ncbi:MAG: energy-coupling factor ABC transporter ATP-binding protein [Actinomycetes bacterium]|jgi:cobalt/nickel transport system ATP-binding protein|nr:energy-coupling factor ABC transporter ATP-binding protein [Actinomycetes bacterium]
MNDCPACENHLHRHGPHADDVAYVSCVSHHYPDGTAVTLCGLDFCAHAGERTVLLGPNGSGKTTLLSHLLGLLRADEGTVRVLGADPSREWRRIRESVGVMLQQVDAQLIMPTVADDVAFSPRQYGWDDARVNAAVRDVLQLLQIDDLAQRSPQSLSGGQKRKVALAGALVCRPRLLVLDEPFEGLDPAARGQIVELLAQLSRDEGVSVVMSTHDIDALAETADYCYVLQTGGRIVLAGTPAQVFDHPDVLRASNIRPPILSELFERLGSSARPLTIDRAVSALQQE